MAVEVLHDRNDDRAVFFCNSTDWAFGPVHSSDGGSAAEELELFREWLPLDARRYKYDDMSAKYSEFRGLLKVCDCGGPYLAENGAECCTDCADLTDEVE